MIIKYYKDSDLAYANRKRRRSIESYTTDLTENQKAVKLGDGATTSIITSEANLCNYVTIGDTRWYVVSYTYLNGGQVELNLRRDVIGEFGLEGCVGKIERGYTESFLRNRKELDLNQILTDRIALKSSTTKYGNYNVSTHDGEMWGVIYLTKPTELDPITGLPYSNTPSINIPSFAPPTVSYTYIPNNTRYVRSVSADDNPLLSFYVQINHTENGITTSYYYRYSVFFKYNTIFNKWEGTIGEALPMSSDVTNNWLIINSSYQYGINALNNILLSNLKNFCYDHPNDYTSNFPMISNSFPVDDYNNAIIEYNSTYIQYSVSQESWNPSGSALEDNTYVTNLLQAFLDISTYYITSFDATNLECEWIYFGDVAFGDIYTYRTLTPGQSGTLTLDLTQQLVDEPYIVYVFPLYDVSISGKGLDEDHPDSIVTVNIDKSTAFMIFNTVIQYCSGENAYLVDAQIYPYCPNLTGVGAIVKGYPFFSLSSTAFLTYVDVQLKPYKDIKKEYIKREYCLLSPDQSGSFKFNYYDYSNDIVENPSDLIHNYDTLTIIIKTALKPINIISSAVIIPHNGSLKGITYNSDLRGCQTTSNGFEFSLSTNKFQEYVRNNSNYQAIFSLQREELQKQHQVEKVNEQASIAVNTITASMMGAIGGASLADYSYFGSSARGAGAAAGLAVAGATVGGAMGAQYEANNKLREYEEYLQKQNFNLQIGTIKNIPNQVSRISSFNEIIMRDFYYVIEIYECSDIESSIVDNFIEKYGYGLNVIEYYENFKKNNWFLRGTLITSNLTPILHTIAEKELMGGIYYIYE